MKIFVSIISHRDPLLHQTIQSLMDNKSQLPIKIIYGVFEQIRLQDSLFIQYPHLANHPDVRYKRIDPEYSDGVQWARLINSLQMDGDEDFYYQIDSHMIFDKDWDRFLFNDFKIASRMYNTHKIILGNGTLNFRMVEGKPVKESHPIDYTVHAKFFEFQKEYFWVGAFPQLVASKDINYEIRPAAHIFAGNMFTHVDWIKDVGFNHIFTFGGEEQFITLKSFDAGYRLCHPSVVKAYHLWDTGNYVTKQNINQVVHPSRFDMTKQRSFNEMKKLVLSFDDDFFERFRVYSGVDYINRKLETRCRTDKIVSPIPNDWDGPDRI